MSQPPEPCVERRHIPRPMTQTDDRALFYNRTLFREAGLDPGTPPARQHACRESSVLAMASAPSPCSLFIRCALLPVHRMLALACLGSDDRRRNAHNDRL